MKTSVNHCRCGWFHFPVDYPVIWLQDYVYRVEISSWLFLGSALLIRLIALLVTEVISYRAAVANPAESLRYD